MRTFLACSGINGRTTVIEKLEQLIRRRRPDAVLFAGGLFALAPTDESPAASAERRHQDMRLLEQFFVTLGATRTTAAVIPGPADAPLRAILMAGMNARSQSAGGASCSLHHGNRSRCRHFRCWGELTEVEDSGRSSGQVLTDDSRVLPASL